jgi:hypothetical protein
MNTTPFQEAAIPKVTDVLRRHGIEAVIREAALGKGFLEAVFQFAGRLHVIELGSDFIQMEEGESLFETHSWRSQQPREAMIDEFATRLDRFLGGKGWDD